MTFWTAFSEHLPTLALVHLGAGEAIVGLQGSLRPGFQLLQLPTLRAVAHLSKRTILIGGQLLALVGALPLVFFAQLAGLGEERAVALALASLAVTSAGLCVGNTVWFPLLNAYMEPGRVGRFFGTIRTGWHLTLILFFAGSQLWLARHPGVFGPLFGCAWALGLLRIAIVVWLPERSERTGERIRVRQALAHLRAHPLLRRYLAGVTWSAAVRLTVAPFAIVMLRRVVGFTSAEVLYATVATFTGGLASLYLWGHAVDRFGPEPIFRWAAIGMGALHASLALVSEPGPGTLAFVIAVYFLGAVLVSGYGLADTHVLFELTPPEAPSRTLVTTQVTASVLSSLAPLVVGLVLQSVLAEAETPLPTYRVLFLAAGALQAASFLPLRVFARRR
jgi:Major Facilitator Superfamily